MQLPSARRCACRPTSRAPPATRRQPPRPARGAQLAGDARQARGEQEHLDAPMAAADRVREVQEHARVALHRAADVAQQDDRPRPPAPLAAWQRYDVAAGAEALAQRAPEVEARPAAAHPAARAALAGCPGEPRERCARERDLVGGELREVLVRERRGVAPGRQRLRFGAELASRRNTACRSPMAELEFGLRSVRCCEAELSSAPDARQSTCRARCGAGLVLRSRQNASKARSKMARSSWRCTSSARHVW